MRQAKKTSAGFTLLEMIAMLALLGAVVWMVNPFFQSGVLNSHEPVNNLAMSGDFNAVMANIVADYESGHNATSLPALKTSIGAEGSDQDNAYGEYKVVTNSYLTTLGSLTMDNSTGLLVTIQHPNDEHENEKLTHLFTVY